MPRSMPTFCNSGLLDGVAERAFLRMNVAFRDAHVAMPSKVRECPRVEREQFNAPFLWPSFLPLSVLEFILPALARV